MDVKSKWFRFLLSEFKEIAAPFSLGAALILFGTVLGIYGKRVNDRTIIAEQKEGYPLEKCLLTNKKLNTMGKATDYVYENSLVRFCCKGCIKVFEENPEPYMKKLAEAYKQG